MPVLSVAEENGNLQRYREALLCGNKHISSQNWTLAQLCLRRAFEYAPDNFAKQQIISLYNDIKEVNPLSFSLGISVVPSSNVNNGTAQNTVMIGGVPFEIPLKDQQLQGYSINTQLDGKIRLPSTELVQSYILLKTSQKNVVLDQRANSDRSVSMASNTFDTRDFNFGLEAIPTRADDLSQTAISVRHGKSYLADKHLSSWQKVSLSHVSKVTSKSSFLGQIEVTNNNRHDNDLKSSFITTSGLGVFREFDFGASHIGLGYQNVTSASNDISSDAITLSSEISLKQLINFKPTVKASFEKRDFGFWQSFGKKRIDKAFSFSASVSSDLVSLYGFIPSIDLNFRKIKSSVALYDRSGTTFGFSVSSEF